MLSPTELKHMSAAPDGFGPYIGLLCSRLGPENESLKPES